MRQNLQSATKNTHVTSKNRNFINNHMNNQKLKLTYRQAHLLFKLPEKLTAQTL